MKPYIKSSTIFFSCLLLLAACNNSNNQPKQKVPSAPTVTKEITDPQPVPAGFTGTVIESISTAGYTYVQIDTGTEKIWAAAPEFKVVEGETITVPPGMPMKNYQSKTLNRTFDLVWFVSNIESDTAESLMPATKVSAEPVSKEQQTGAIPQPKTDPIFVKKAEQAKTIAEIFEERIALEGKNIKVRAQVVKFIPEIMGKNWVHIQDGTGDEGMNDLTLTTKQSAQTGDIIVAEGVLVLNKDFGYGYIYELIIEDAKITTN